MGEIIAITNQKGGVGKTTTCVNLSAGLVLAGKKVLMIDIDPQGNASVAMGIDKNAIEYGCYDALIGDASFDQSVISTEFGIDVLAANDDLAGATVELLEMESREFRLKQMLALIQSRYDYIFIDCPPTLNILTINALVAANSVMIPVQCEYYALEGLTALVSTVEKIKANLNPALHIKGLIKTMYDARNSLTKEVVEQLKTYFGELVYDTEIPRNVRLAEAPGYGQPIFSYDASSAGARSYKRLIGEFLVREESLPVSDAKE